MSLITIPYQIAYKVFSIQEVKILALQFEKEAQADPSLTFKMDIKFADGSSAHENNKEILEDDVALAPPIISIRIQVSRADTTKFAEFFIEHGNVDTGSLILKGEKEWVRKFQAEIVNYIENQVENQMFGKRMYWIPTVCHLFFVAVTALFLGKTLNYIWPYFITPAYIPNNNPNIYYGGSYLISFFIGIILGGWISDYFARSFPLVEICIGRGRNNAHRKRRALMRSIGAFVAPIVSERIGYFFTH